MNELVLVCVGGILGVAATLIILYTLDIKTKVQVWFLKRNIKVGNMYAMYEIQYPEFWIIEKYTALYQVEHLGKEYIHLKLLEDKHKHITMTTKVDVRYEDLERKYRRYKGVKDTMGIFDGLDL